MAAGREQFFTGKGEPGAAAEEAVIWPIRRQVGTPFGDVSCELVEAEIIGVIRVDGTGVGMGIVESWHFGGVEVSGASGWWPSGVGGPGEMSGKWAAICFGNGARFDRHASGHAPFRVSGQAITGA